jgi:hypothetical protein
MQNWLTLALEQTGADYDSDDEDEEVPKSMRRRAARLMAESFIRLGMAMHIFSYLVKSRIPPQSVDIFLKSVTHLYKSLGAAARKVQVKF